MTTDELRRWLLDHDLTEADLRRAAEVLEQIDSDEDEREALRDYDRIRQAMGQLRDEEEDAEVPNGGWDAVAWRIMQDRSGGSMRMPRWQAFTWAALLLVAITGWAWRPAAPEPIVRNSYTANSRQSVPLVAQPKPLNEPEVDHQLAVFREVSEAFDHRAAWVALSDEGSDIGLAPAPPATSRIVLLRLAMSRDGRIVSQADMAIVPGQQAELTTPLEADLKLRYRITASRQTPSQLGIWAQLDNARGTDAGETIAALATRLYPQPGRNLPAGRLATSSGGYDLIVSYAEAPLDEKQP